MFVKKSVKQANNNNKVYLKCIFCACKNYIILGIIKPRFINIAWCYWDVTKTTTSAQFSGPGLDGDSSDRCLICVAIGHQLLKLQSPSSNEAERRTYRSRAIDWTLPEWAERMGIVKGDTALLDVQTHTQPWRKRIGDTGWRGGAVTIRDVPVIDLSMVGIGRGGQVDLAHTHCEEGERGQRVWRVFGPTVMATVRVIPAQVKKQMLKCSEHLKWGGKMWVGFIEKVRTADYLYAILSFSFFFIWFCSCFLSTSSGSLSLFPSTGFQAKVQHINVKFYKKSSKKYYYHANMFKAKESVFMHTYNMNVPTRGQKLKLNESLHFTKQWIQKSTGWDNYLVVVFSML